MTLLKNAFIVATVLAAQGANAWSFEWRDNTGAVTSESGKEIEDCKTIDHAGGKLFNWDPKDQDLCILMYSDDHCKEGISGKSCPVWDKNASGDISAFRVVTPEEANGEEINPAPTETGTESGSATGTASETGNPTATGTESGSNTAEPTGEPTQTGSATESGSESGTGSAPSGTATHPASHSGADPTDAPSSSPATDAPATSTQTGAAAPTGAPAAGIFGALAAAAAFAI